MIINSFTNQTETPIKEMKTYNTYARMPIYLNDESITEVKSKSYPPYLYANLDLYGMNEPYGYWTHSSSTVNSISAWYVYCGGGVFENYVGTDSDPGVRPVITLKI